MFDPSVQMNPWMGVYGFGQPFGGQQFGGQPFGIGWQHLQQPQGFGFGPHLAPQTWFGNPLGGLQSSPFTNPLTQQAVQQIPYLVHHAQQIAQQVPQLIPQIPQLIQQNPQLLQQAPQLQQIPQLLQQAALLAQQLPHVLQALCSLPQTQTGGAPFMSGGGYRPFGYGLSAFA